MTLWSKFLRLDNVTHPITKTYLDESELKLSDFLDCRPSLTWPGSRYGRGSPNARHRSRDRAACADAMTRKVRVPDEIFAAVRRFMNDQMMVELTATIGAYNMRARFLVALEIHP